MRNHFYCSLLTILSVTAQSVSAAPARLLWSGGQNNLDMKSAGACTLVVQSDSPLPASWSVEWAASSDNGEGIRAIAGPALGQTASVCALRAATDASGTEAHADTAEHCTASKASRATSAQYAFQIPEGTKARFRLVMDKYPGEDDEGLYATLNGGGSAALPPLIIDATPTSLHDILCHGPDVDRCVAAKILASDGRQTSLRVKPIARNWCIVSAEDNLGALGKRLVLLDPNGCVTATTLSGSVDRSQVSSAAEQHILVRFRPDEVALAPGAMSASIGAAQVANPGLANALSAAGVVRLERLFPWFSHDDVHTTNRLGEPITLDDLTDIYLAYLEADSKSSASVAALTGVDGVIYAEPDLVGIGPMSLYPNDPLFGSQWAMRNPGTVLCGSQAAAIGADAGAPAAWDFPWRGQGVPVGVLDTGVDASHEDLYPRVTPGPDFTGDGCSTCDEGAPLGHGTAVASIIGGSGDNGLGMAGVSWRAPLVSVKVLRACSPFDPPDCNQTSWTEQGIEWSRSNGLRILNMSIGGYAPAFPDTGLYTLRTLRLACYNAVNAGMFLVASSGNAPIAITPNGVEILYNYVFPAFIKSRVFAVGAVLPSGNRWRDDAVQPAACSAGTCAASNYLDYDYYVDAVAPGGRLITAAAYDGYQPSAYYTIDDCTPSFDPYFESYGFGGTSAAAPVVTGIAAALVSCDGSLDGSDLEYIIDRTATDVGPLGRDHETGYGLVKLDAALQFIMRPQGVEHGRLSRAPGPYGLLDNVQVVNGVVATFNNVDALGGDYHGPCTKYVLSGHATFDRIFAFDPQVWIRASGSSGWSDSLVHDGDDEVNGGSPVWGTVDRQGANFKTCVYKVGNVWVPTDTAHAAVAFSAAGTLLEALSVDPSAPGGFRGVRVFPNPMMGFADVSFIMPRQGYATVELFDVRGRCVRDLVERGAPGVEHRLRLHTTSGEGKLTPGVYWMKCSLDSGPVAKKLVVLSRP